MRSFRWLLRIEGIPEHLVRTCRSLPGRRLEIGVFWVDGTPSPPGPAAYHGALCLLDRVGKITHTYDLSFSGAELLQFDLDYGSAEPTEPRWILNDVQIARRDPRDPD
jgi:hypothetical protein